MLSHEILMVYVLGSFYELLRVLWFLVGFLNAGSGLWSAPTLVYLKETPT